METCEQKTSMSAEEKEEMAEKLYAKAKQLLGTDIERAEKYLLKAERLHSTPHTRKLLKEVQKSRSEVRSRGPGSSRNAEQTSTQEPKTVRRRRLPSERVADQNYTMEQVDAVRRITRCQTYYEIFEVSSEASADEIKASYKKLSFVLHPDKNQAPGSTQAFQMMSSAADILLDQKKRKEYDDQLERERQLQWERERMASGVLQQDASFEPTTGLVIVGTIALGLGLLGMWLKSREEKAEGQGKSSRKPAANS